MTTLSPPRRRRLRTALKAITADGRPWPCRAALLLIYLVLIALAVMATVTLVYATDTGQFKDISPEQRSWFQNLKGPRGVPCCSVADGHPTDYEIRKGQYWVPINGEWVPVPPEAVLDTKNPYGQAVVWYSVYGEGIHISIRCFVRGAEG